MATGYALEALDIDTLDTSELREVFKTYRKIAVYEVSKDEWMEAVTFRLGDNPTPAEWVYAAQTTTTTCGRCHGSGVYSWGASVNGKMTHSGSCNRCQGKGYQGQSDYKRNWAYDRHAIARAFREMS